MFSLSGRMLETQVMPFPGGMLETQVMPFPGGCLKRRYFPFQGDHFGMGRYEGESTQSCEARFSPSSSPFPGTQLL